MTAPVATRSARSSPAGFALGAVRWLDRNLEKSVLLLAYSACAVIIAVEVFRRYALSTQAPWSTTIPAYMFLWVTWLGAAYGVKIRAHLSFGEVRDRLSRRTQYLLMQMDYLLYLVFGLVVIHYSGELLSMQMDNFSVVPGTDDIPQWWFYSATPVGWCLLLFRVLQNAVIDFRAMRTGAPLKVRGELALD